MPGHCRWWGLLRRAFGGVLDQDAGGVFLHGVGPELEFITALPCHARSYSLGVDYKSVANLWGEGPENEAIGGRFLESPQDTL